MISQQVLDGVEDLAREEGQSKIVDITPLFEWEDGLLIDDAINGIYDKFNIDNLINDHGDHDSYYVPLDDNEDDGEEQEQQIEEVEQNLEKAGGKN